VGLSGRAGNSAGAREGENAHPEKRGTKYREGREYIRRSALVCLWSAALNKRAWVCECARDARRE
jgi:hypothetical protein